MPVIAKELRDLIDANTTDLGTKLDEAAHDALPADNPHSVTLTQVVTADGGTDVSAAELETLTDGSDADALHSHSIVTYQSTSTTPVTLTAGSITVGMNIVGVTAPAGLITINIPAGTDPTKLILPADERDPLDQDVITVVSL